MSSRSPTGSRQIGAHLRQLRLARGWSQVELSRRLRLSQSRLSGIERGRLSLTAEEFLEVLRMFNVPATDFVNAPRANAAQLQNALERLGATHLRESPDVLPSELVKDAGNLIREVLTAADSPRHITALAPVLVRQAERINFAMLRSQLNELGLRTRLGWLVDNTVEAARYELIHQPMHKEWSSIYRRAVLLLEEAFSHGRARPRRATAPDVLDRAVRSSKTLRQLEQEASTISRRWNIVTAIQVGDFVDALRASRVDDS
jgi:transcriptional regulator with XRE-family HTH domain